MASFDVLSREFDVSGGLFLEASAGTGKTFAIEHLVLRLLLEGEHPLSIDEILVVTFTRAATRELKMRIRSNIERAKGGLDSGATHWDYLQALIEQGEEKLFQSQARLEEALVRFDEAAIFTIHGFCHKVLSEGAFEAKVGFSLSEPESKQHLSLLYETLFDALRTQLTLPSFSTSQILHLLRKAKGDPRRVVEEIHYLIEKGSEIPTQETFKELLSRFNDTIEALSKRLGITSSRIHSDLSKLILCYKQLTGEGVSSQINTLSLLLEKGKAEEHEFDALLRGKEFFLEKMTSSNQKVRARMPDPSELHYPTAIEALQTEILPIIQQAKDPQLLMLRLAKEAKTGWTAFFAEREHVLPDDLLKKTNDALEDREFLKRVQQRYLAIIVDEFQDTDPVQFEIIKKLCKEGGPKIYLVGDPKQSIYGFRRADVYTYLKASTLLPEKRRFFLGTNYRSDPDLLHSLNILFSYSKNWLPLPAHKTALSYQEVKAPLNKEGRELQDGKGALHFVIAQKERGREKSWPTKEIEQELFFPFICSEILSLHHEGKIPLDHIAILVKDRFQAERTQVALKKNAIPSRLRRKESAAASPALIPLIELLEGCLYPGDSSRLKRALASPFIGWGPVALNNREQVYGVKPLFVALHDEWENRGIGALYHKLLQSKIEGKRVIESLLERKERSFFSAIDQLFHMLINKECEEAHLPHELLNFLKNLFNESVEEAFLPPSQANQGVQIMTMHMSKGLEFEIVFALGLSSRHMHADEFIIEGEQLTLASSSDGAFLEIDAEKLRQLYVALTRAKRRVYIPLPLDVHEVKIQEGTASPLELFCAQLKTAGGENCIKTLYAKHLPLSLEGVVEILKQMQTSCSLTFEMLQTQDSCPNRNAQAASALTAPPTPIYFSVKAQPVLSFSSLTKKQENGGESSPFEENLTSHGLPLGAETGVVVHHILEQIFALGYYAPFHGEEIALLVEEDVRSTPLEKWKEVIFEMIKETLHLPLPDPAGAFSLVDLKPGEVLQEIEFIYPSNEGYLKGFIDLAFERNGRYYFLDWKTNYLGPDDSAYSLQNMERCMKEHDYFLQVEIYTEGLKRYLAHFDRRPFDTCFGGAFYLFLRGRKSYFIEFCSRSEFCNSLYLMKPMER